MSRYRLQLTKDEVSRAGARQPGGDYRERAARAFYEVALGGRQVWPTGPRAVPRRLWFLVGSTLLRVSLDDREVDRPELHVDSPAAVAQRCWDAGYTIHVRGEDSDDLIVIDPFGRELVLMPSRSSGSLGAEAAG